MLVLQVSFSGSGVLLPTSPRSSCRVAGTARPSKCPPAMVSSKTSSRLLLSTLPRSLSPGPLSLGASQVCPLKDPNRLVVPVDDNSGSLLLKLVSEHLLVDANATSRCLVSTQDAAMHSALV